MQSELGRVGTPLFCSSCCRAAVLDAAQAPAAEHGCFKQAPSRLPACRQNAPLPHTRTTSTPSPCSGEDAYAMRKTFTKSAPAPAADSKAAEGGSGGAAADKGGSPAGGARKGGKRR